MIECECGQLSIAFGFHLALTWPPTSPEEETKRIAAFVSQLSCDSQVLKRVESAVAKVVIGLRRRGGAGSSFKKVYVCGGIGHDGDLLLAVTHQGTRCGRGDGGPVTCEANAWQAEVAGCLLNAHLIDRVEFRRSGRQLVLGWRSSDCTWPDLLRRSSGERSKHGMPSGAVRNGVRPALTVRESTK